MSQIELRTFDAPKQAGAKPKGVTSKTRTTSAGEKVKIRAIDANSDTFSEEFLYVFKQNVRAARDENQKLLGSRDGVKGSR